MDYLQALVGAAIVAAPGLLLVRAIMPELDWPKTVAAAVIVSLTVPPATMFVLNLFLGVPVSMLNGTLVFLFWAAIGLSLWSRPWLTRALSI